MHNTKISDISNNDLIHPTAIVHQNSKLGKNVHVGPYSIVGEHVCLGDNVKLHSHVVIDGHTTIGKDCEIFPFACVGTAPQDLKYAGEDTKLEIGSNNIIREYATLQPGTVSGTGITIIGSNCLFMASTHVAHDCRIGNNVIMSNNATLGGHVHVGENVVIGGLAAVHQYVRIGKGAMIGGTAAVKSDVIPFAMVMPETSSIAGFNVVGLKRKGISREDLGILMRAYEELFDNSSSNFADRLDAVSAKYSDNVYMKEIIDFLQSDSTRPLAMPTV